MKKKIVWLVTAVVALVMMFTLSACKDNGEPNNQQDNEIQNQSVVFEENENSFSIKSEVPQTEVIEREITITPYQSGTIIVNKEVSEGYINVDIVEKGSVDSLSMRGYETASGVFNIDGGVGEYEVRFDLDNFVGSCDVTWEVEDIYFEEIYTSDLGYELKYIPEKFDVINENGKEKFALKSDNQDDTELYFMVYMVNADSKETEKSRIKADAEVVSECIFAEGTLLGEYASFPPEDGTQKMNFMFDLNDGRLLVIETLKMEEYSGSTAGNAYIDELIASFVYEQ